MAVTAPRALRPPTRLAPGATVFPPLPAVWVRWVVRLVLAAPFVVLALVVSRAPTTPLLLLTGNEITFDRASTALDGGVVQAIGQLYPLLSGVVLRIMPFGVHGAAVLGGVVAGIVLQVLAQAMVRRGLPMRKVVVFTIALGANPLFAFVALNDLQAFVGIVLFALALTDLVRFSANSDTQAGFRAGLVLMASTLVDPMGLVYLVVAAIAVPLVDLARQGQRGARAANTLVVVFPSVAVLVSMMVLDLIVMRDPFAALRTTIVVDGSRVSDVLRLFTTADGLLLVVMLVAGCALALLVGRPGAIGIVVALFAGILGGYVIGLIPPASAGNTFVTMMAVAIAIVPRATSRVTGGLVIALMVLQIPLAWAAASQRAVVVEWVHAIATVVQP
ncbi:hypothetical protein ACLBWP_16625 [Microbacterium sp. M1A1_1b]